MTYNLVHNYILVAFIAGYGLLADKILLMALGLILSAHIGTDRFLGFGLKYPNDFRDTHVQRL